MGAAPNGWQPDVSARPCGEGNRLAPALRRRQRTRAAGRSPATKRKNWEVARTCVWRAQELDGENYMVDGNNHQLLPTHNGPPPPSARGAGTSSGR
eukprot:9810194-Lingulodinium_polyedra.AAC.1